MCQLAYLRYGLMCRHVIDESSPLHGFSMGRLKQGDASFTVTVVGMERTSMQPIFHMKDYYAFDDDVVWDGDFQDFVYGEGRGGCGVMSNVECQMSNVECVVCFWEWCGTRACISDGLGGEIPVNWTN